MAKDNERLPPPDLANYTPEQKKAAEEFQKLRGEPPFGPFELLLHSPQVMANAQRLGEYLRYHSAIGVPLSEFAVLIVAREWSQDFEWHIHAPIAAREGVSNEIIAALRDGKRPSNMSADQEIVYDFSIELQRGKSVSDETYAKALKRFGPQGVIDLTGTNGYYAFLAMQMNAAQMKLPEGGVPLPKLQP
jgi:4-carboxymuconolactone decarboxylase